jgi:hypothetical protein
VCEAFSLVRNLETAIPQEHRGNLEPLRDFTRGAVTSDGGAVLASVLITGWSRLDHSATPGSESWYYALVGEMDRAAAIPPASLPPLPPPPANNDVIAAALVRELDKQKDTTAAGKLYFQFKFDKILPAVGAAPPHWPLMEASPLKFWRDLKPCRKGSARGFMESYRNQRYPTGRLKFVF